MKKGAIWALLIGLALAACSPRSDNQAPQPLQQAVAQPEPTPAQEDLAKKFRHPGMYKVGSEIPAGRYMLAVLRGMAGYYQIARDSSGTLDSIISNDNFTTFVYADLRDGDYFQLVGAGFALRDELPISFDPSSLGPGEYIIGTDIPAGEYKLTADETGMAYWQRSKNARGTLDGIIANENFDNQNYVTVQAGELFKITNAAAVPVQ